MQDSAAPHKRGFPFRRILFWGLIVLSIGSLLFAPLGPTIDRVKEVGPWVAAGLLASEALFVLGLALMAATVGVKLGPNPLRWRSQFDTILAKLDRTPMFWVGLILNTVGALGTGVVILIAVLTGLPPTAWGLLVLPLADLSLTAAVRAAVVGGVRGHRKDPVVNTP
ncbi:MAG: hypothetical protein AAF531_12275 [Actinomycetota bacterium]